MTLRTLEGRSLLLIISGGIAAYKSLELIRRLRERGARVRCILTAGGAKFVTPLSVAALSEEPVYQDLWELTDHQGMAHIRLAREADLVVIAPASANLLARMAAGLADDLASTLLLAHSGPVMAAPAMNVEMWRHKATQQNLETLKARGVRMIGPGSGDLACGEMGDGRMSEAGEIVAAIENWFRQDQPLKDVRALVTSGPTQEPLDPVRFISNRSSGKQGHAVAAALADLGAEVTLVSGPCFEATPPRVRLVPVQTAEEMLAAAAAALPVHVAVCAAAVADWRAAQVAPQKIKKGDGAPPALALRENPDILRTLAALGPRRPRLLIGFAAETGDALSKAEAKLKAKGCDWIVANDVAAEASFGSLENRVDVLRRHADGKVSVDSWPRLTKVEIARRLAALIAEAINPKGGT